MVVGERTLSNGLVTVTLDSKTGDIASIVDRDGNQYAGGAVNSYRYLRGGDAPSSASGPRDVRIFVKDDGPLVASLQVESKAEGCDLLTREIRLIAGQPHVDIVNTLHKIPTLNKEGVHFGFAFNVVDPRTRMDIPWGIVEVEKEQFPEGNRNWITFQRWLDISGTGRGVTWCSLDAPMFEQGDITANIMGEGRGWLRKLEPSATIYSWALNNHWFTNFPLSQGGRIVLRYRILPHASGYDAVAANRFGMEQSRPLIVARARNAIAIAPVLNLGNPNVFVSSVKSLADGVVVTLRSVSDKAERVELPGATVDLAPYGRVEKTLRRSLWSKP